MDDVLKMLATLAGIASLACIWALAIWTILGRPSPTFGRFGGGHMSAAEKERLLPARYQNGAVVSSAPMEAAELVYDEGGYVAWDQIWGAFCDLAWAGGPPHRATVLRPGDAAGIEANPHAYATVIDELARGLILVTGWQVWKNPEPGRIGLICPDPDAAQWLDQAIAAEKHRRADREGQDSALAGRS